MDELDFYYLDEAAKKRGYEVDGQEAWKNPLIRLGASRKLPIYILTNGLTLWEQVTHAVPAVTEDGDYCEEIVTDELLVHNLFKRVTLSPHCLRDYAAGKEETEAFTDEGRVRKAASFMMAGDFVKTWVKIKDPRTGNAPMLKDCVMVVLPNDLKQLHESVPQTETQEIFDSSVDAEAFIRDSNNPKGEREKRAMQLVIEKLGGQEAPHGKKNLVYTRYGKWQSEFPEFNNADTVWKKGGFRSVHANSYVRTKKQ